LQINFEGKGREFDICSVGPNGKVKYCIMPLDTQQDTIYRNADDMLDASLTMSDCVTLLQKWKCSQFLEWGYERMGESQ